MTTANGDNDYPRPRRQDSNDPNIPRLHLLRFLVAGVLFMEFLDGTVIATALPVMARSFATDALTLNVGISAYLLALGVFIPISGWMSERFGARQVFITSIAIFTVASLLCGIATSLPLFVAFRVMQGFGGAMMVPVGRLMVMQHTPKNELVAALSALVWPALVAPVIGPSLGGFIATYANWRWIFFLNLPLGLLAMIVALAILPKTSANTTRQFDWSGFILCTLGISIFLYGTEQLASVHGEIAGALMIIAAGTALALIAIAHMQRAENPMLDLSYFKIPTFTVALRGGSLIRLAIGSAPFLLPLMFQLGFGWNAFQAGSVVIAVFVGNLVMKFVTTPIIKRFGFRPILLWNSLLCSLSLLACAFFSAQTPLAVIVVILFISGLARSLQFTAINTIAFADIPRSEMASANTLFSTAFQLSLGAGVAVGAVAVRMGASLTKSLGMTGGARDYQFAFWIVSILALLSLGDSVLLARGSGDTLIGRESKT